MHHVGVIVPRTTVFDGEGLRAEREGLCWACGLERTRHHGAPAASRTGTCCGDDGNGAGSTIAVSGAGTCCDDVNNGGGSIPVSNAGNCCCANDYRQRGGDSAVAASIASA